MVEELAYKNNIVASSLESNNHILATWKGMEKAIKGGNFTLTFYLRRTTENSQNSSNKM